MKEVPLTHGLVAIVDQADYESVIAAGPWHARIAPRTAYVQKTLRTGGRRREIQLHNWLTGWPYVDHVNGDGLDNRRANLRPATAGLNQANRGPTRRNKSGFKGVSFENGRWRANIKINQRQGFLGYFNTPEEAARAYDAAALAAWGEYARLNFPGHLPADTDQEGTDG